MSTEAEAPALFANQKYWGEERQKDAVYAVYLRKVRYLPPPQFEGLPHYRPVDPENHHLGDELLGLDANRLQWETIRERVIKAGTIEKLVESLVATGTSPDERHIDSRHFNVFLATYRAYSSAEEVLGILIRWYERLREECAPNPDSKDGSSAKNTMNTIRSVITCWLDTYQEDFYSPALAAVPGASNSSPSSPPPRPRDQRAVGGGGGLPALVKLIQFARGNQLKELERRAKKLRAEFQFIAQEGGLASKIPSLAAFCSYPPQPFGAAVSASYGTPPMAPHERLMEFGAGGENCVQIAEQLTFWDAALLRELKPYQCQGAIWGRRHKGSEEKVYSVRATIDQFNSVSRRVMSSIVLPECRAEHRARIIEKWVDVARELRALKNFSSLKAVISSLQSEPVHRLSATWLHVSRESLAQFKELEALFEMNENGEEQRARYILDLEGTAKCSSLGKPISAHSTQRHRANNSIALSCGTVPYLGSFLTDLTMLDQAYFDKTPEGLWNFEKRRREFEVLAKIRLFQSAANSYAIPMDRAFCIWFIRLPSQTENECYARSLQIEPLGDDSTPRGKRKETLPSRWLPNGSPALIAPRVKALAKSFGSNRKISSLDMADEWERDQNSTGAHRPPLPHSQSSTSNDSMTVGSSACTSSSSCATPVRERHRRRSSSTAPSTPLGTLRRAPQLGRRLTPEQFTLSASEFVPHPYGVYPYMSSQALLHANMGHGSHSTYYAQLPATAAAYLYRDEGMGDEYPVNYRPYFDPFYAYEGGLLPPLLGSKGQYAIHDYSSLHERGKAQSECSPRATKQTQSSTSPSYDTMEAASPTAKEAPLPPSSVARRRPALLKQPKGSPWSEITSSRGSSIRSCSVNSSSVADDKSRAQLLTTDDSTNFYFARVGIDDSVVSTSSTATINYKCIKVVNGDRMSDLIGRALEKHLLTVEDTDTLRDYYLVQLLPDGNELKLPEHCNPFYAVAPDPSSKMLNFLLKKRSPIMVDDEATKSQPIPISTKRANKQKRSDLLRWSSGFL